MSYALNFGPIVIVLKILYKNHDYLLYEYQTSTLLSFFQFLHTGWFHLGLSYSLVTPFFLIKVQNLKFNFCYQQQFCTVSESSTNSSILYAPGLSALQVNRLLQERIQRTKQLLT